MTKGVARLKSPSDEEVRLLLVLYKCPVPFHIVRTRLVGVIASGVAVSPIEEVKRLWGGNPPQCRDMDFLNELMEVLVMGLWNRLARHQERRVPIRLLRVDVPLDREGLGRLALTRREELEGFVQGLIGPWEEPILPERAYRALDQLSQIRGFLHAVEDGSSDATKRATQTEIANTLTTIRTLTGIAEHEMHEAVLSCTRSRRDMLRELTTKIPTFR